MDENDRDTRDKAVVNDAILTRIETKVDQIIKQQNGMVIDQHDMKNAFDSHLKDDERLANDLKTHKQESSNAHKFLYVASGFCFVFTLLALLTSDTMKSFLGFAIRLIV